MMSSADKAETKSSALGIDRDVSAVETRRQFDMRGEGDSVLKTASREEEMSSKGGSQVSNPLIQYRNTNSVDKSLSEMTKPTFVPNNTPVQSPLGSPQLEHSATQTTQILHTDTCSSATRDSLLRDSLTSTSSLPELRPPSVHFPQIRLRDVLRNDDNGGCLPPKPENVAACVGEKDHVVSHIQHHSSGIVKNKDGTVSGSSSQQDNDNSPIAIINRRNFFNTSDSRSSGSLQPLGASGSGNSQSLGENVKNTEQSSQGSERDVQVSELSGSPSRRGSEQQKKRFGDRSSSSGQECGIAPTIFYFDKDRSVTDPYVKHDQANEKIRISSWINSKQNAQIYSLIENNGNSEKHEGDYENNKNANNPITCENNELSRNDRSGFSNNRRPYSSDGFISPQPPRSALSMSSSLGGGAELDLADSADSIIDTRRFGDVAIEGEDEKFIPPPPPKFINSKLDGLRTRLLVNPRANSNKFEDDIGTATAAAVLSNMRSTPLRFSDRSQMFSPNNNTNSKATYNSSNTTSSSRPGSSSFSSVKNFPRPVIRVHQRESPLEDTDESAILDDNDDEDDDEEYGNEKGIELENDEEKAGLTNTKKNQKGDIKYINDVTNSSNVIKRQKLKTSIKEEDVTKEVTWNKNGKRVTTRKLLESPNRRRRPRNRTNKAKESKDDNFHSDTGRDDEDSKEEEEDEEYTAKTESQGCNKKNSMGSRSRTGCWICRLRKKKCTEERPHCFNCERLNLECNYGSAKPDFILDPAKKQLKLEEIKKKTKEAKRNAMRKKPFR
ncbi:hypothetical protein HG535_0F04620 [Zygotorulaspora mrakii]|uniref:Zn(2)-C6 fungal-type domain-containing protein n=1 Tax=Zygotorulaspora mrakii TaxID=42260 RepID=A0A7H9B5T5_ZYGMR|nr:uncharacterized protein HG535_0F04620 [Zygotorulaspora mrakii]QLG73950.1 hypothetical protein HG535_0F04620 [Zygotorulaspora mrakii]